MPQSKKRFSIILQVAIVFLIGILTTGTITFLVEHFMSEKTVKTQTEERTSQIAEEVKMAVLEYPSSDWLLRYWYEHNEELDIEYDVAFGQGTKTEEKSRELVSRNPSLQLRYAQEQDILALSAEDQKTYAEVLYSWLITRVNQIKRSSQVEFLFCVLAEEPYEQQFFLFSAAEPNSVRGKNYEDVYPLGTVVSVGKNQQEAMRNAHQASSHLADAGKYVDYYSLLTVMDGHDVLIGLTYNLSEMRSSIQSQTIRGTIYAITNQVVLSLICLFLLFFFLLHPLQKVLQNIRLYRNTKDSRTVNANLAKIQPRNEVGQLSEDIADLSTEIDNYLSKIESITAERERMEAELSLATRIQTAMLPRDFPPFPERTEFDLYASMDPARDVGGDFYDFFLIDEDHLALIMADVSGKGIPAALFMMASKIILANNAKMGKSPAQVLRDTNNSICSNNRAEMFVTVWLGILEISTGRLIASNGGHEYPIVKMPDGQYEMLKDHHDFVVGAMNDLTYHEYEIQLKPGSRLLLYTDGLPEATDAADQMFGKERILEVLNENTEASPQEIIQSLKNAVGAFVREAEQFDDLTMLAFSYFGSSSANCPAEEITVDAVTDNIPVVTEFVNGRLDAVGCTGKPRIQIAMAIDEIFSNIAYYAYGDSYGQVTVRFSQESSPPSVALTFIDSGVPYNPLQNASPDTTLPAEERQIGGLGIFLVKKTMDDIQYEYKDGQNHLCILKRF